MSEWTAELNLNFTPKYRTLSYRFLCQGTEQFPVDNFPPWDESELADLCDNLGPAQGYFYPATAELTDPEEVEQAPLLLPLLQEPQAASYDDDDLEQFDWTGMVYYDDAEAGPSTAAGHARENDGGGRGGSESASDSEQQTSPDSWSSGSGVDSIVPQADPLMWALRTCLDDVAISTSPDSTEDISIVTEQAQAYGVIGHDIINNNNNNNFEDAAAAVAPNAPSATKGKVRAAFSEAQMGILTQRFSVQRYLTPAEMKSMAEITGLTYKQVKTWFQNRRMKLRRHQKDNSWASERYALNKDNAGHGAAFPSLSTHMQPYQGQARTSKDHYNPHMFAAALKTATPPNLALYLAAVGGGNASAGYPTWPNNAAAQSTIDMPQVLGWPLPPNHPRYGYNARFNTQSLSNASDEGFKEEEQQVRRAPYNPFFV